MEKLQEMQLQIPKFLTTNESVEHKRVYILKLKFD